MPRVQFTKAQQTRYFRACERIRGEESFGKLHAKLVPDLPYYVTEQTLRNWWAEPGAIPSEVAVVLASTFDGVEVTDFCPWLSELL